MKPKIKLRLFWSTKEGNEWLAELHESDVWNLATIMHTTSDFIVRTKANAQALVHRWNVGGEDVDLSPMAESDDKTLQQQADEYLDRANEKSA